MIRLLSRQERGSERNRVRVRVRVRARIRLRARIGLRVRYFAVTEGQNIRGCYVSVRVRCFVA